MQTTNPCGGAARSPRGGDARASTRAGRSMAMAVVLVLITGLAQAQSPPDGPLRIRITGGETFQIPGVLQIDRSGVTGIGIESTSEAVVRVRQPGRNEILTVPRPRQRLVGHPVRVSADT